MLRILDTSIRGVQLTELVLRADERGTFAEAFRASWFPGERRWVQCNVSRSKAGVLRGMHFHRRQTDYWLVVEGTLQVGLVDLRVGSPSHRQAICLELDGSDPRGLIIPAGVLHGYRATRDATVMYLMDQEYDATDEFGVRWDDQALGLPEAWYAGPRPTLSPRDTSAPLLRDAGFEFVTY